MKKAIKHLLLCSLMIFLGCTSYKQISLTKDDFFTTKRVTEKIDKYNVYVHDNNQTYKLMNPRMTGHSILGEPDIIASKKEIEMIKSATKKKDKAEHKNDISVYVNKTPSPNSQGAFEIPYENISKVDMYEVHTKGIFASVLGIILIIALAIAAIVLIIVAIGNAANAGSQGSADASSGSAGASAGSAQGSDNSSNASGNSSNNGSGCYIATMVYGDYDAPEVLVLRKFRDEILQPTAPGRAFIKWYYTHSPGFVEKHRHRKGLHKIIRFVLDKFVFFLSR